MTGQAFLGKFTSEENNGKRPRDDDDDDEQITANKNDSSESSTKRRRTSRDDDENKTVLMGDGLVDNEDQAEPSSSSSPLSSGLSNDESLSDIEVDIDDLESIHGFDIEHLGEFEMFGDHYDPMTGDYGDSEAEGEVRETRAEDEQEDEEAIQPSPSSQPPSSSTSDSSQFQEQPAWSRYHGGKEYLRHVMAGDVESDLDDEF